MTFARSLDEDQDCGHWSMWLETESNTVHLRLEQDQNETDRPKRGS